MKNKKRIDNNGFSLVELIIVIAIMAVLIGVLAPQYMRYVERGRLASDNENIKAIESALQVHFVDTMATNQLENGDTIVLHRGAAATAAGGTDAINEAIRNAGLVTSTETFANLPQLTNTQSFDTATITVRVDSNGNISVSTETSTNP